MKITLCLSVQFIKYADLNKLHLYTAWICVEFHYPFWTTPKMCSLPFTFQLNQRCNMPFLGFLLKCNAFHLMCLWKEKKQFRIISNDIRRGISEPHRKYFKRFFFRSHFHHNIELFCLNAHTTFAICNLWCQFEFVLLKRAADSQ